LICALTHSAPEQVVGRGTGVDDAGLARKREIVAAALARVGKLGLDSRQLFAHLGGLEIAAMAGMYIEAARQGVPVLLDGYISAAAAVGAAALESGALRWMLASHRSAEAGHSVALQALGLEPLIDLRMRLGEGSGAAVTLPIIKAALCLHRNMATF